MRFLIGLLVVLPLTGCFPAKPVQHATVTAATAQELKASLEAVTALLE